jgi:hypothetical protein
MSDKMSIDKQEHSQEHSEESVASTPDNGAEPMAAPQDTQPVKRKGGRKPVSHSHVAKRKRDSRVNAISPCVWTGGQQRPMYEKRGFRF